MPSTLSQPHTVVSIAAEMPESLFQALGCFLDNHPSWSEERAITAALCLFLMQNGHTDPGLSTLYVRAVPLPDPYVPTENRDFVITALHGLFYWHSLGPVYGEAYASQHGFDLPCEAAGDALRTLWTKSLWPKPLRTKSRQ